tara:strand:+ start:152 stop:559 length:408 start_codon:yes stop_codon:yes gene_type:complete
MKKKCNKILGIVVLGLLLSGNAYAKKITFDCSGFSGAWEKKEFEINTSSKVIKEISIWSDDWMKTATPKITSKINVVIYELIYLDDKYAKGQRSFVYKDENRKSELEFNLNNKTYVNILTYGNSDPVSFKEEKCK